MSTVAGRAMGVGAYMEFRGKKLQLSQLNSADLEEALKYMIDSMPSPLQELVDDPAYSQLPLEVQKELAKEAVEKKNRQLSESMDSSNMGAWLRGVDGLLFMLWRSVKRNHSEYETIDSFLDEFKPESDEDALSVTELNLIMEKIDEVTPKEAAKKGNVPRNSSRRTPKKKKNRRK